MLLLIARSLPGAVFVWDDGFNPDDFWSTGQNWVGNTAPPTGDVTTQLEFTDGTQAINDLGTFTLEKITFDAALGSASFDISGDDITLAGTHDIDLDHTGFATISNNLSNTSNLQIRGDNGGTLTISGDITGTGGFLTKFYDSTLILSGNNSFDNRIRIRGGILDSQSANGLGGAIRVDFEDDQLGGQTPTLRISTVNQTFAGTLRAESDDTGFIDIADGITFTVNGSGDALRWDSDTSAFFKQGQGTLALEKASTGGGLLTIEEGTVSISDAGALGNTTNGTVVESGGTLDVIGGITVSGEALTLAGSGQSGVGALASSSGSNTWDNDITLSADSTIANNAGGSTLTIGSTESNQSVNNGGFEVTIDGDGDILFNAQFSGSGGLTKNGSGTTTLSFGTNTILSTYSGETVVNEGTLIADLGASDLSTLTPLTGDITIGDGTGTDTFDSRWVDNIGDSTNVRVNSSGVLEVGGFYDNDIAETIGSLTLEGGALAQSVNGATTVSSIVLNGDVTRVATGNTTANINGNLDLGGATRIFNVADSSAGDDLDVAATVSNGGLSKSGAGNLVLSGTTDNTHSTTTVDAGTLTLSKSSGTDAVSGSVTINGGTLLLGASNQIEDATVMTLAGGSFETQGNSEVLGTLTLDSSSSLDLGGSGVLDFADSSAQSWSGSLTITDWQGDPNGGGANQIFFGSNAGGLTQGQLNSVAFVNPFGFAPGTYSGLLLSTGELVPVVPEPGTFISGALLAVTTAIWHWRRKRRVL